MQDRQFSSDDPFIVGIPTRKTADLDPLLGHPSVPSAAQRSTLWARTLAAMSALSLLLLAALPL